MTIKLGQKVRDKITGYTGIATGKTEYLTGCVQYIVAPQVGSDGKFPDSNYIDESRLEVVDEKPVLKNKNSGNGGAGRSENTAKNFRN